MLYRDFNVFSPTSVEKAKINDRYIEVRKTVNGSLTGLKLLIIGTLFTFIIYNFHYFCYVSGIQNPIIAPMIIRKMAAILLKKTTH